MPFYRFSASSSAPEDGFSVIAPYVGTGRWLLLREDAAVGTISALQSIPPQQRSPDLPVYVSATNTWYGFKSAPATLPTDIAPTIGGGSWAVNTAVVEVIPPYQRINSVRDATARADRIETVSLSLGLSPYREAIAHADRITSYSTLGLSPYREAIAHADRITPISLSVGDTPYQEAIAHADRIESYSIAAGTIFWLDVSASDWLDLTTAEWLDLPI